MIGLLAIWFQFGNLAEWAAAIGTSAAVLLTASVLRSDRRERRELEALKIEPSVGPVSSLLPDAEGRATTEMLVSVANNSIWIVKDVDISVQGWTRDVLESWGISSIGPLSTHTKRRTPGTYEWAKSDAGRVFEVFVEVRFTDHEGRRWLRDSIGSVRRLDGTEPAWLK